MKLFGFSSNLTFPEAPVIGLILFLENLFIILAKMIPEAVPIVNANKPSTIIPSVSNNPPQRAEFQTL
jgi:hypothetical protein